MNSTIAAVVSQLQRPEAMARAMREASGVGLIQVAADTAPDRVDNTQYPQYPQYTQYIATQSTQRQTVGSMQYTVHTATQLHSYTEYAAHRIVGPEANRVT